MLFEVDEARLQNQIDLVQQELREIRLIKELLHSQPMLQTSKRTEYILWQERQIQKRSSFLETVRVSIHQLHNDVEKDMDALVSILKGLK